DRAPQRRTPMGAIDLLQRLVGKIRSGNIKPQMDNVPIAPETSTKQKNDSSAECGDFGFRPLTEREKKEFVNSLDAKAKKILAELEGKPIGGQRRKPAPSPSPMDATLASDGNTGGEHPGQISRHLSDTHLG